MRFLSVMLWVSVGAQVLGVMLETETDLAKRFGRGVVRLGFAAVYGAAAWSLWP